ncbi:MAG: guanylate kinase, partial [Lachnospiraceae bacterium]|nr:guanylate kinase [Lachnospiraceae bacterium]
MGKLFYIMGKSASGKDTLYRILAGDRSLGLRLVIPYTTRPVRQGEREGETYHFVD